MTGISVRGLSKHYGRVPILQDVDFDCPTGQITGLLGPNGSGKTSIMRLLTELSPDGAGTASFDGRRYGEIERPAREIGVLLDASAHHPGRSVFETVRVAGLLMGVGRHRVGKMIALMGLSTVSGRRFGALSLGMKQRVGLAIALLGSPRFLVLDEPVNGLDVESIHWLREILVSFCREEGGTVLISSHLLRELESYADRVVILSRGRVVMEESIERLRCAATCDVVTDDPAHLRSLLDVASIRWQPSVEPRSTTVEGDGRTVAQLALDNRVLVTELVPGGNRALERVYLRATSGEFATTGTETS